MTSGSLRSRFVQLGKDTAVYGIGGIMAKSLGFFLLPVFTRVFNPGEYGAIEMVMTIGMLAGALMTMGLDSAQSYYFFDQQNQGRPEQAVVVTSILQFRLLSGLIVTATGMAIAPLLNASFFDGKLSLLHFAAVFLGAWFTQQTMQASDVFRLQRRPWRYLWITLLNTTLASGLALLFSGVLGWGVLGYLTGVLIAAIVATAYGLWSIRTYLDFSAWHSRWWPRVLKFGVPLLPAALALYALNSVDRWFISYYHGPDELGIFAVGTRFASIVAAAVVTFRQAWWPAAMETLHQPDGARFLRVMARYYLGACAAGVVLLAALAPPLVSLMTAPAYHRAFPLVGILAWQGVFYGFYLIVAAGIWKSEKTGWAPIVMVGAVAVDLLLIVSLVPRYSAAGAAVATAVSFLVWNILTLIVSERLWRVGYPYWVLAAQIIAGMSAVAGLIRLQTTGAPTWQIVLTTVVAVLTVAVVTIDGGHLRSALGRAGSSAAIEGRSNDGLG